MHSASDGLSLAQRIALLPQEQRDELMADMDPDDLLHDWSFWARPNQMPPPGDWGTWLYMAGRGSGKALDLSTPIATPDGWTAMGDLSVGDTVFDEAGDPCTVIAVYDQEAPDDGLWRITFSDGSSIDADGSHQWVTLNIPERRELKTSGRAQGAEPREFPSNWAAGRKTRTTATILNTLRRKAVANHCIPIAGPLNTAPSDLPIDPYLLGYWLGDGSSKDAVIYPGDHDVAHLEQQIAAAGETFVAKRQRTCWSVGLTSDKKTTKSQLTLQQKEEIAAAKGVIWAKHLAVKYGVKENVIYHVWESDAWRRTITAEETFRGRLRSLNLLNNKHIPLLYLRASIEQRTALLQGLMDSDGYIDKSGKRVEVVSVNERLADDILELARSLSERPTKRKGTAKIDGIEKGPKYTVAWNTTRPATFRLPRKAERYQDAWTLRSRHRTITAVERIPDRPVRCITVDSPNAMYLAGEAMIPTHNTRTASEWIHQRVREGKAKRILLLGRTSADVRDVMLAGEALSLDTIVPTSTGRTTMGELCEGDEIIGGDGRPCRVIQAFAVLHDRPCYRVTFKSGASVIADANHKWATWDWPARVVRSQNRQKTKHVKKVRTTEEIADMVWYRGQRNYAVDVVGSWFPANDDLPLDPYTFGAWLGDGANRGSEITLGDMDAEHILQRITRIYPVTQQKRNGERKAACYTIRGIKSTLRHMRVLHNKHIPDAYLRASWQDRLALLQGLMDTDGSVSSQNNSCEIGTVYPQLRDGIIELLATLGIKSRYSTREAHQKISAVTGRVIQAKESYQITFLTEQPVASLDRHLQRLEVRSHEEQRYDYITSVEPVDSVPVRCIAVDSPDHCFMVTNRFIPTHNSGILNTGHPDDKPEYFPSKRLVVWPNGAEATLYSADEPDQLRGPQGDTAWCIAAGVPVATARGLVPVESVAVGDTVMTRAGFKTVTATRSAGVKFVLRIVAEFGEVRCTADHRVWVEGRGWVFAGSIRPGDIVTTMSAARRARVLFVEPDGSSPTYDLTVDGAHEFFAGGILVHNCDEFASFPGVGGSDGATAFDNLRLAMRLPVPGDMPRMILTTTPRRTKAMFDILDQSERPEFGIVVTKGTTYENLANLADTFRATILGLYEGTRLGQQELMGDMLADIEGALFKQEWFDQNRVDALPDGRMYAVVGVDPSVADRPTDECGIVVVKATMERDYYRRHVYVVEDASVKGSPSIWAAQVARMARKWDAPIVAEGNQGGELVRMAIAQADGNLPVHIVHAKVGKATRAEPVAALFEQGRGHVVGSLPLLESQATNWVPSESRYSPDRVDACVAEGTLVDTIDGQVPVQHIRAGDMVATRVGWREVLWAGVTGEDREVCEVVTDRGSFVATPDHLVWADGAWRRVDALTCGMVALWRNGKSSNGAADDGRATRVPIGARIGSTTSPSTNGVPTFTSSSTKASTDPSLTDSMFITSTATPWTTVPRTLSHFLQRTITRRTKRSARLMDGTTSSTWNGSGRWLRPGTDLRKGWPGTGSTGSARGRTVNGLRSVNVYDVGNLSVLGSTTPPTALDRAGEPPMNTATRRMRFASSAGLPSVGTPSGSGSRSIAGWNAGTEPSGNMTLGKFARLVERVSILINRRNGHVARNAPGWFDARILEVRPAGNTRVYDLTVDEAHEFVADGHLVHNCTWAILSVVTRQKGVSFAMGRHLRARSSKAKLPTLNAGSFLKAGGAGRGGRR